MAVVRGNVAAAWLTVFLGAWLMGTPFLFTTAGLWVSLHDFLVGTAVLILGTFASMRTYSATLATLILGLWEAGIAFLTYPAGPATNGLLVGAAIAVLAAVALYAQRAIPHK